MKIGNSSTLSSEEKTELVRECVENFNLYLNRWPDARAVESAVVEWEGEGCFVRDVWGRDAGRCGPKRCRHRDLRADRRHHRR